MLSWLAPIIVFGLVVFVHELGHFIAAKLTGVYAPRFSIGFGPSLLKKRYHRDSRVLITSLSRLTVYWRAPMTLMLLMPVEAPSSISNTRSTRFCASWITLASTVAAKRPVRR